MMVNVETWCTTRFLFNISNFTSEKTIHLIDMGICVVFPLDFGFWLENWQGTTTTCSNVQPSRTKTL